MKAQNEHKSLKPCCKNEAEAAAALIANTNSSAIGHLSFRLLQSEAAAAADAKQHLFGLIPKMTERSRSSLLLLGVERNKKDAI